MNPASPPREAKASVAQVAATIFFGLFAIGKKNTWEKDGVTVTPVQVVVGALVGLIVLLIALISLVMFVTR
jgi:hypothetical protein